MRQLMTARNISLVQLAEKSGIPRANLQRMTTDQEPKASALVAIEKALGVPVGTVLKMAGLVPGTSVVDAIRSDPAIHPIMQDIAVETYETWVRVSKEFAS